MPAHKLYENAAPDWAKMYAAGTSLRDIGRSYRTSPQTVWRYLNNSGVVFRSREEAGRRHPIRVDAFKQPIGAEAAYWIGLLYADGGMVQAKKTKAYSIGLVGHSDDVESLEGFRAFLGLPPTQIHRRPDKKAVETRITSKTVTTDLRMLGVVPRKAFKLAFPEWLTCETAPHFIRGVLDGDGCVRFAPARRYVTPQGTVSFTGYEPFITAIAAELTSSAGVPPTYMQNTNTPHRLTVTLTYRGRNKLAALFEYLYRTPGPRLTRKYETYRVGLAAGERRS